MCQGAVSYTHLDVYKRQLYRYNPDLAHPPAVATNGHEPQPGRNPFQLDSKAPTLPLEKYIYREGRYRMLQQSNPEAAERLLTLAKADVAQRWETYHKLALEHEAVTAKPVAEN